MNMIGTRAGLVMCSRCKQCSYIFLFMCLSVCQQIRHFWLPTQYKTISIFLGTFLYQIQVKMVIFLISAFWLQNWMWHRCINARHQDSTNSALVSTWWIVSLLSNHTNMKSVLLCSDSFSLWLANLILWLNSVNFLVGWRGCSTPLSVCCKWVLM